MKENNKIIKSLKGIYSHLISEIDQIRLFLPMKDALSLLKQNNVSVYFFNRIGKLKGYEYPENAKRRMKGRVGFPKMLENPSMYRNDFIELFGDMYSENYIKELASVPQIIKKGEYYCHEDFHSRYLNVSGGYRVTCGCPKNYSKTIHMYGRCGVFGYAVEDGDTLPSCIQALLNKCGYNNYRVINHGLWGGCDNLIEKNFLNDVKEIQSGDIVIFYLRHFHKFFMGEYKKLGLQYRNYTKEWHEITSPTACFFDKPGHMNAEGYRNVAHLILGGIELDKGNDSIEENVEYTKNKKYKYLDRFLNHNKNKNFEKEINNYLKDILIKYPYDATAKVCGAIVMNCNPFTKGHRYLIEYAAQQVDRLYIFVVEEDKSIFEFADRFNMVQRGVSDIKNVIVVPSGKFMISTYTFPEYFMKEYVKKKNFDVSMDVEIFCKYIAPAFSISIRFAGKEPFDPVTAKYNETMADILPKYGLVFVEVPRLSCDNTVISATKVRMLLNEGKYEELLTYIPRSTYEIIEEKYMEG